MSKASESPVLFAPGFSEDVDMTKCCTDELAAKLDREVVTARYYDKHGRQQVPKLDRPSIALSKSIEDQLAGEYDKPEIRDAVGHSYGAVALSHWRGLDNMAMLAPAGLIPEKWWTTPRYIANLAQTAIDSKTGLDFVLQGAKNVLVDPRRLVREAKELSNHNGYFDAGNEIARRVLMLTYHDDLVFPPDDLKAAAEKTFARISVVDITSADGHKVTHNEPFLHPESTTEVVAKFIRHTAIDKSEQSVRISS